MADSFLAQKLPEYTDSGHPEPVCHHPFTFQVDDQLWSVACSGAWFFAVRGTSSFPPVASADPLPRWLRSLPLQAEEVDIQKLRGWAGEPVRSFAGSPACGVLLGRVIDRRRLAALLAPLLFPKLTVWDTTDLVGVASIGLESKGKWRAILAGLSGEPEPKMPVFAFREAAGISLMEELPEELPGKGALHLLRP